MRLLNVQSLELVYFNGPSRAPEYVILSHTWGEEEVTFADMSTKNFRHKKGFSKIEGCRKLARKWGFEWFWVDTCCIDQSSSSELSESINSMYEWYEWARFCFAYLADLPHLPHSNYPGSPIPLDASAFRRSDWFRRGWTLQELLAPRWVNFYDASWEFVGDRENLYREISEATGINERIIRTTSLAKTKSIAMKLSWASGRMTSRPEDMAYCLMGLLEVNMPLLYGEGCLKAFRRLQLELIKDNYDHTILTWGLNSKNTRFNFSDAIPLLAHSPNSFYDWDSSVNPLPPEGSHYFSTNLGLQLSLPIIFLTENIGLGVLECGREGEGNRVALPLSIRHRKNASPVGERAVGISPILIPASAVGHLSPTTIYLNDRTRNFSSYLELKSCNLSLYSLADIGYTLIDYFPPNTLQSPVISLEDPTYLETDKLLRFSHKVLDDLYILYRCNTNLPMENCLKISNKYVAIAIRPNSQGLERQRKKSWELLLAPDFNKIDFEQLEKSLPWSSSVETMPIDYTDLRGETRRTPVRIQFKYEYDTFIISCWGTSNPTPRLGRRERRGDRK
ncbi:HET-domain-containing protein [Annulohypoxylon maeteangense]|uniref:HET-domain-containing protein n=1 Tax=Annulohypoxylon maeteangense TaxID=1927788 RepID=UPI0020086730|nr:HET-domain-containing protein [Annulohypoxylon maeteangense]KAI0881527.1 HET-domain-containing protein [Annulohypoxylon maeteangense]